MKKIVTALAGCAAVAVTGPAFAQDATTFQGPRVEAIIGYDVTKAGSSIDDDINEDNKQSIDGLLYGVGVGYDLNLGGIVIGPEAEITGSTAKVGFDDGDWEGFGIGNVKTNRDLYIGARVGAEVMPGTLLYAKGGYTNAKFDVIDSDGTNDYSQDIDADGWRVGAGVEHAFGSGGGGFGSNLYAKLEYRYSNYSKAEIDYGGALPDSDRFDVDLDRHQIVAGVGVRF